MNSLVGSWGPMMFAQPWQAFLEWQAWNSAARRSAAHSEEGHWKEIKEEREVTAEPVEGLVTNYFQTQNARIWTPWHVR